MATMSSAIAARSYARRGRPGRTLRLELVELEPRVTPTTMVGSYAPPAGQVNLSVVLGTDSNIWYAYRNSADTSGGIGFFSTSKYTFNNVGSVSNPNLNIPLGPIAVGSDGAIWYVALDASFNDFIDRYSPITGRFSSYNLPGFSFFSEPTTLVSDAGLLWVASSGDNNVTTVDMKGATHTYSLPIPSGANSANVQASAASFDGSVWFVEDVINVAPTPNDIALVRGTLGSAGPVFRIVGTAPLVSSIQLAADSNAGEMALAGETSGGQIALAGVSPSGVGAFNNYGFGTPHGILPGPDQSLWISVGTGTAGSQTNSTFTQLYGMGNTQSFTVPAGIVAGQGVLGPSGTLFFANATDENSNSAIVELTGVAYTPGAWVQSLYNVNLGRAADFEDQQSWVAQIGPLSTSQIAAAIDGSAEGDGRRVQTWYESYLGRAAEPSEIAGWVNVMQHGSSDEQVQAAILGSIEYALRTPAISGIGGSPNPTTFVTALFLQLLGHAPSSAQLASFDPLVNSIGRQAVAAILLGSAEYRGDVVASDYTTLLHRTGSAAEIAAWVGTSMTTAQMRTAIEASAEYILKLQY